MSEYSYVGILQSLWRYNLKLDLFKHESKKEEETQPCTFSYLKSSRETSSFLKSSITFSFEILLGGRMELMLLGVAPPRLFLAFPPLKPEEEGKAKKIRSKRDGRTCVSVFGWFTKLKLGRAWQS